MTQMGGQAGNGHARQHGAESGHGVVVKLGTITPDGKGGERGTAGREGQARQDR